jgi:hypothetical protein
MSVWCATVCTGWRCACCVPTVYLRPCGPVALCRYVASAFMKESEEDTDSGDEWEEVYVYQEVCLSEHVAVLHC